MTHVSELAVLAVFVTLGINLPLDALWDNLWGGLVVMVVFLFVARPLTVLACLLPDRRGRWTREEIVFLSWCRETGVVPAAVAGVLLARGVEGAELVAAMVALAVVTTLLVQATTAGLLARRLGLVETAEYVGRHAERARTVAYCRRVSVQSGSRYCRRVRVPRSRASASRGASRSTRGTCRRSSCGRTGWSTLAPAGRGVMPHPALDSRPCACFRLQRAQWR